jgi:glycosyltransferase involved in cell wall biosynthesis
MLAFPVFLSVVCVLRNERERLETLLTETVATLRTMVADFELIIVDNASVDESVAELRRLAGPAGLPNLQVFALTKEVDGDTANWVGLENALGDYVAVLDPLSDDPAFIRQMLDRAGQGADVVFAANAARPKARWSYRVGERAFHRLYSRFAGVDLGREAPKFRLIARRVVNFILQHRQPVLTYRHLPATGGFARAYLEYSAVPKAVRTDNLGDAIDRGLRLLFSTTRGPMRVVTALTLFGAAANLLYTVYVVAVALWVDDVAPGWVSLSLQQSGMFFLISLVLFVLGEYMLSMASLSNDGPLYHVSQEFTSATLTRRERLNIEEPAADGAVVHRLKGAAE